MIMDVMFSRNCATIFTFTRHIEIDIKNAFDFLGEITGEANPDELITALFTKFCLGK